MEREKSSVLTRLYLGKKKLVAFVDEAYSRTHDEPKPFYVMTAVIIPSDELNLVRGHIAQMSGERDWHTTDRAHEHDFDAIRDFIEYMSEHPDPMVIVLEAGDTVKRIGFEDARRYCFNALAKLLREAHNVGVIVYERRRPGLEQKLDDATSSSIRAAHPGLQVQDAWSQSELLLAAPDAICWALRRRLVAREGWFDPLTDVVQMYRADGERLQSLRKTGR